MSRLSRHFTLAELVRSSIAVRNGIDNTPPPQAVAMLKRLANEVLEPIRRAVDRPVHVTSGYRCFSLNSMVGGALNSAHMAGGAADFVVPGMELYEYAPIAKAACDSLPVGKLIQEFGDWLHVQIEPLGVVPRRIYLTAEYDRRGVIYRPWA